MRLFNLCLCLFAISCRTPSSDLASKDAFRGGERSITPQDSQVGKWLVTITVGGPGIKRSDALMLRDWATAKFTKAGGGFYSHAIDINDKHDGDELPTLGEFNNLFSELANKIANFKRAYPGKKTMVAVTLTAHGIITSDEKYQLRLLDKWVDGDLVLKRIEELDADETILILQSCHSGGLIDGFVNSAVKFNDTARTFFTNRNRHVSIITPVTRHLVSPLASWERIITKSSFDDEADNLEGGVKDHIVTYNEWRNYLKQLSCLHEHFSPVFSVSGNDLVYDKMGIDPQFFESKIPANLPMFLTKQGEQLWRENALTYPEINDREPFFFDKTKEICKQESLDVENIYKLSLREKIDLIEHVNGHRLTRILDRLKKSYGPERSEMIPNVLAIARNGANAVETRLAALALLGTFPANQEVYSGLRGLYESLDNELLQLSCLEAIASLANSDALPLLLEAVKADNSLQIRQAGARGLTKLNNGNAFEAIKSLLYDTDPYIRSQAASGISSFSNSSTLPRLRELFQSDRFAEVRLSALESLQRLGGASELSVYARAVENETDDKILTFLIQNFLYLPEGSDVSSLVRRNIRDDLTPGLIDLSIMVFIQQKQVSAKPVALKGLTSESWLVRKRSVEFLGSVTPHGSEEQIGNILGTDQNVTVRLAAVFSLKAIGTDLAKQLLRRAVVEDDSQQIRDAANHALSN